MNWAAVGLVVCILGALAIFLFTAIPQRHPRNQRLKDVLPAPSPSCNRNYVP